LSRFAWSRLGRRLGRRLFRPVHAPFGDRLRIFGVGGARFAPEVARQLTDLGFVVIQAYGMTETAALATLAPPDPRGVGSVGTAMAHDEIRIDQPDDQGIGEVLIRGENVMAGYYRNPDATHEAIRDGWLHSGDLGYLDREGFLYITGRAKDVVVLSSGKNIYPEEIEHFYQSNCSLIQEICVVGLTEGDQERLHAVIVPDFEQLRREKIVHVYNMIRYMTETLSQRLPAHKRIRSLEIWREPLPRTPTRKIKRYEVEQLVRSGERLEGGTLETSTPSWEPGDQVEERLAELLKRVKETAEVSSEANLELDIGLDSLERVEFLSSVQERFGIEIPEEEAAALFTFREVAELVRSRVAANLEGGTEHKSWREILSEPLNPEDAAELSLHVKRRPTAEAVFVAGTWVVWFIARLLLRLRGEGMGRLPGEYPFLLCPNHASYLDSFLVTCLLPSRAARRFCALAYEDYVGGALTGFLSRQFKVIPVNSDANLRRSLRLAAEGLRAGLVLEVFPEGERSIDGRLKTFRKGPAILATAMRIPVVPVGIRGTHEVWPRGSNSIRLHPVRISFGEPLIPAEDESAEEFNERLREAVGRLM
jgi:long-chain acyl-CoA synthetase